MKVTLELNFFEARAMFNVLEAAVRWSDQNGNRKDLEEDEYNLNQKVVKWQEVALNFGTKVPGVNG